METSEPAVDAAVVLNINKRGQNDCRAGIGTGVFDRKLGEHSKNKHNVGLKASGQLPAGEACQPRQKPT